VCRVLKSTFPDMPLTPSIPRSPNPFWLPYAEGEEDRKMRLSTREVSVGG
jgi:hypothetical protein